MAKETNNGAAKEQQKLSYEQLEAVANRLGAENNYLKGQLNMLQSKVAELSDFSLFKRLEFLFKVIETSDKVNWGDFLIKCTAEIEERMTLPEQSTDDQKEQA